MLNNNVVAAAVAPPRIPLWVGNVSGTPQDSTTGRPNGITDIIDLLVGLFRGAVFCHGGGCPKTAH